MVENKYYKVIIKFFSEELDKQGNPKITKSEYIVHSKDVEEANKKTYEYLEGTLLAFELASITETKVEAVIK